jgi:hypothetical protein
MPGSRLRQGYAGATSSLGRRSFSEGGKSGHDNGGCSYLLKSRITPLATSLFQMNRTTSAPMVAVMKPAPWSGL